MPPLRFLPLLLVPLCFGPARAAPLDDKVAALYRPWLANQVALSPDGEHLAYTQHDRGELAVYIMAVVRSEGKFRIAVEDDRPVAFSREKAPAALRFLAWASPTRLVFAPTPYHNGVRPLAPILAIDIDGKHPDVLLRQDDLAISGPPPIDRASVIRGFVAGDRTKLLVEALGRETFPPSPLAPTELFALDPTTGKLTSLVEEFDVGRFYYDPAGKVRLMYDTPRYSHTRKFYHKIGGVWDRWTPMNEAWGGPLAKSFPVTIEGYFGARAFPVAVDSTPDLLYYASNVGRDTYAIYGYDTRAKRRTELAIEEPHVDLMPPEPASLAPWLVYDPLGGKLVGVRAIGVTPFTRWIDPELAALQRDFDRNFSRRTVELLQWDDARERFLLRVTGLNDPGRYHVFRRTEKVFVEVLRAAPWLRNAELHAGTTFAFDPPNGGHLTGYLTFPRKPRLTPPPLLVAFSDGVMGLAQPGFDREAQVLAEMGFVVARLNHRGMSGFGLAHRDALRTEGDRAPVADALAAVEWIAAHHAIDRRRIATFGQGLGGYLALRALQLAPEAFRCAVAIDAPLSPQAWLQPPLDDMGPGASASAEMSMTARPPPPPRAQPIDFVQEAKRAYLAGASLRLVSVLDAPAQLTKPVMLILNNSSNDIIAQQNASLRSSLRRLNRTPDYFQSESAEGTDLPGARAVVFRRMETFFNLNLYDFGVKVGPTKEVK